jgi:PAS domain S-box-containing protein
MGSAAPDEKGEPLSTNENGSAEVPLPSSEPARVGLWEWDLKTKQFYCSFEFRRQLGVGETEPIAGLSDLEARLHPGDQERVKKSLHKFLTSGEPSYEMQYRLPSNDNTFHWMRLQAELIHDQSGQPSRIIGYQQDITMLKMQRRACAPSRPGYSRCEKRRQCESLANCTTSLAAASRPRRWTLMG